jgi:heme/copper-type cytochrome/quinol oxidase subunit 3
VLALAAFRNSRHQPQPVLGPVALYWHFVDAVWLVVFSIVYLRPLL